MNVFCHPGVLRDGMVPGLLGAEPSVSPCFGFKARVPLANGELDRTDVDLRLGNQLQSPVDWRVIAAVAFGEEETMEDKGRMPSL
jgi:hypothetical protein